jgi:predicted nucleic-acid-binding protein
VTCIEAGDRLEFIESEQGFLVVAATRDIRSLKGVAEVVTGLLTTEQLHVDSAELVWRAKRRYEASKGDFSDAPIAECAVTAGCKRAVTFDRAAAATSGFGLLTWVSSN